MKYFIIFATLIILIACQEESPDLTNSITTENKYTIEELENDTDWVEITDTLQYSDHFCFEETEIVNSYYFDNLDSLENSIVYDSCEVFKNLSSMDNNNYDFIGVSLMGVIEYFELRAFYNSGIMDYQIFITYKLTGEFIYMINTRVVRIPENEGVESINFNYL